jgi:hypothetical protein
VQNEMISREREEGEEKRLWSRRRRLQMKREGSRLSGIQSR